MNIITIYEASERKGGIQVHVSTLTESLQKSGNKVIMFPVSPLFLTKQNSVQRIVSLLNNSLKIFTQAISLLTLNRVNPNINVIHVHGPRVPLMLGLLLSKLAKIPLVITMHEPRSQSTKYNPLWKKADRIIVISKEILNLLLRYGGDETKIVYIPNMVQAEPQGKTTVNGKNILFIGRLHPDKVGILKVLLKATPQILKEISEAKIVVVGPDGSSKKEIEKIASQINQDHGKKVVTLVGYTTKPEYYISQSKLVVGEARVAIESMIQGKPTIVGFSTSEDYFVGDLVTEKNIRKLEEYNFTGVNYDKKIDPNKLSKIIIDILLDKNYTKKVAEYNRTYILDNFENEPVTNKILTMYNEAIIASGKKDLNDKIISK